MYMILYRSKTSSSDLDWAVHCVDDKLWKLRQDLVYLRGASIKSEYIVVGVL